MSSPATPRIRKAEKKPWESNGKSKETSDAGVSSKTVDKAKRGASSEWDYKITFAFMTLLAFVTRFWGISHPAQVVFDEVHFGKVGANLRYSIGLKLIDTRNSSLLTTFSGPTFSTFTLPLASFCLHSPAG